jgi:hypothetical protein
VAINCAGYVKPVYPELFQGNVEVSRSVSVFVIRFATKPGRLPPSALMTLLRWLHYEVTTFTTHNYKQKYLTIFHVKSVS